MTRCLNSDELQQFLSGELQSDREAEAALHFEQCEDCQRQAELLLSRSSVPASRTVVSGLFATGEPAEPPDVEIVESLRCFAMPSAERQLAPLPKVVLPEFIDDYRVLRLLAPGSTGVVYLATRLKDGSVPTVSPDLVAIKVLAPECVSRPLHRKRFERERNALVELPPHPNVVRVLDSCLSNESRYLVMEYAGGRNLWQQVVAEPPMSVEQVCRLTLQAAAGLQHVHTHGLIHRDIKPSNLIVDDQGHLKIVDFGIVHHAEVDQIGSRLTETNSLIGTADFMAPEQATDVRKVGPAADIYSLGCTLAWLLTGQLVYEGKSVADMLMAHRHVPVPSLQNRRAGVPPRLDLLFQKMVAKQPEDRPESMGEVIAELTGVLLGLTSPAATDNSNQPNTSPDEGRAGSVWLAVVWKVLAIVALTAMLAFIALAAR